MFATRNTPLLILTASIGLAWSIPAFSSPLTSAKVLKMVDGDQVFIDTNQARLNQTAGRGSVLRTRQSRAELLFNTRAIGLLGRTSAIRIGAECFRLDSGVVVVNGTQRACLGSRILGVRGTTYVLARESDSGYTVSVLAGEGFAGRDLPEDSSEANILSLYPRINSILSVQAGGFAGAYPSGSGSFTGGLSYFTPLSQSSARQILYSSTSLGSSFQNLWGVSTEIGYRGLTAANQTTSGAYIGYSGYGSPGCFSNMINGGVQFEKSRWRIGGSGGVKLNNCPTGLSYGALNLSIPVGRIKQQPLYLSLSPYVLSGNVVSADLLSASGSGSSTFPGFRGTVEVPVSERLSVRAYTGADSVYGLTLGGSFTYRIPTASHIYSDPNSSGNKVSPAVISGGSQGAATSSLEPARSSRELAQLAMADQGNTLSDVQQSLGIDPNWQAQAVQAGVIREGQRGRFSADGDLLSIEPISNNDFLLLLTTNLKGQNPLPESRRIAQQAAARGVFSTELSGFLGIDYLNNASLAVSTTVDTPFSPLTQIPMGRYICAATSQARSVGAQQAQPGQFDYSGGSVYFGKGSQTSQGYPATYNKSDAYVFANAGVCKELNRLANQGYDVVQAEAI